jgi:hypothetical protein
MEISEGAIKLLARLFRYNWVNVKGFPESALGSMKFYIREVGSDKIERVHISGSQLVVDETIDMTDFTSSICMEEREDGILSVVKYARSRSGCHHDNSYASALFNSAANASGTSHSLRDRFVMFYDKVSADPPLAGFSPIHAPFFVLIPTVLPGTSEDSPESTWIHEFMHSFGFKHVVISPDHRFAAIPNLMADKYTPFKGITRSQAILLAARIWGSPVESASGPGVPLEFKNLGSGSGHEYWGIRELCGVGQIGPHRTEQPFNRTSVPAQIGNAQSTAPKLPVFPPLLKAQCPTIYERGEFDFETGYFDFQATNSSEWRFIVPGFIDRTSGLPMTSLATKEIVMEFKRLRPEPTELAFLSIVGGIFDPNRILYFSPSSGSPFQAWLATSSFDKFASKLEIQPGPNIIVKATDGHNNIVVDNQFYREIISNSDLGVGNLVAIGYKVADLEPLSSDREAWHPSNPSTFGE